MIFDTFCFLNRLTKIISSFGFHHSHLLLDSGNRSWLPDPGSHILAARSWLPDPGCQILPARSWLPDPGYQILATISWLPDPGFHNLATRSWQRCLTPNPNKIFVWVLTLGSFIYFVLYLYLRIIVETLLESFIL